MRLIVNSSQVIRVIIYGVPAVYYKIVIDYLEIYKYKYLYSNTYIFEISLRILTIHDVKRASLLF